MEWYYIDPQYILDNKKGKVYLSYLHIDKYTINETAIVIINGKNNSNRYLILKGDHRKNLEKLYPNIKKLKQYWQNNKQDHHPASDLLNNL